MVVNTAGDEMGVEPPMDCRVAAFCVADSACSALAKPGVAVLCERFPGVKPLVRVCTGARLLALAPSARGSCSVATARARACAGCDVRAWTAATSMAGAAIGAGGGEVFCQTCAPMSCGRLDSSFAVSHLEFFPPRLFRLLFPLPSRESFSFGVKAGLMLLGNGVSLGLG